MRINFVDRDLSLLGLGWPPLTHPLINMSLLKYVYQPPPHPYLHSPLTVPDPSLPQPFPYPTPPLLNPYIENAYAFRIHLVIGFIPQHSTAQVRLHATALCMWTSLTPYPFAAQVRLQPHYVHVTHGLIRGYNRVRNSQRERRAH